ncbi:MAG: DUF2953 domain-containing protein [Eubacterium sp.]|nr:DUF2953 domain-containing protein [Eubacterium sp.]
MKVFLIILAVLVVLIAIILSLSAEFEVVFEDGWSTKVRVLWIEKDIELSKLLNFILFPEKAAEEAAEEVTEKATEAPAEEHQKAELIEVVEEEDGPTGVFVAEKAEADEKVEIPPPDEERHLSDEEIRQIVAQLNEEEQAEQPEEEPEPQGKPNFIVKIWQDEGIVGILEFATNLLETANSAVTTLIKGLHIYSLYVKMIIGGGDAADIAEKYGSLASHYYVLKGMILNQMKVDQCDELIEPDFIAPRSEYVFQIIAGLNVGLLLKVALRAGRVFLVNLIKNKKSNKKYK